MVFRIWRSAGSSSPVPELSFSSRPHIGAESGRVKEEHAHASYPGLFFRPPGVSPNMRAGGKGEVRNWTKDLVVRANLQFAICKLQVASCKLQVASCKSQVASCKLQVEKI